MFQFPLLLSVDIPVGFASSVIKIKISVITTEIKKYKSIIKKTKKKHEKIVLLAKTKLNTIEVLLFKVLIYSSIIQDGFFSVNNVLKEYDNLKKEFKNFNVK